MQDLKPGFPVHYDKMQSQLLYKPDKCKTKQNVMGNDSCPVFILSPTETQIQPPSPPNQLTTLGCLLNIGHILSFPARLCIHIQTGGLCERARASSNRPWREMEMPAISVSVFLSRTHNPSLSICRARLEVARCGS